MKEKQGGGRMGRRYIFHSSHPWKSGIVMMQAVKVDPAIFICCRTVVRCRWSNLKDFGFRSHSWPKNKLPQPRVWITMFDMHENPYIVLIHISLSSASLYKRYRRIVLSWNSMLWYPVKFWQHIVVKNISLFEVFSCLISEMGKKMKEMKGRERI